MASHLKNTAKAKLINGGIDLDTDDIRVMLLMTNTTVDTENDGKDFVTDFTTLDEHNGANYVRKALTGETVTKNDTDDRGDFSANNVTWTALGPGSRNIAGALVYKHVGADGANIPISWHEFTSTPDGNDWSMKWNSGAIAGDILRAA